MKFFCDQCNAKYSIADEKVRGKIVKVRCKRCDDIITVRGDQLEQQSSAGGQHQDRGGGAQAGAQTEWYYSVDGDTFGPMDQQELERRYASGDVGESSYVWNDSFDDWKPAGTVEPFRSAIQQAKKAAARQRKQTMGVDGAVQSIESPSEEQSQPESGDGRAQGRSSSRSPESGGSEGRGRSQSSGNKGEQGKQRRGRRSRSSRKKSKGKQGGQDGGAEKKSGGRSSRLENLRNKLKSNFAGQGNKSGADREADDDEEASRQEQARTAEQQAAGDEPQMAESGAEQAPEAAEESLGTELDATKEAPSPQAEASEAESAAEGAEETQEAAALGRESSGVEADEQAGRQIDEDSVPGAAEQLDAGEDPTREFDPLEAIGDEESGMLSAEEEAAGQADAGEQPSEPEAQTEDEDGEPQEWAALDEDSQEATESEEPGDAEAADQELAATEERPAPAPEAAGQAGPSERDDDGDVGGAPDVGDQQGDAEGDDDFALPPSGSERLEADAGQAAPTADASSDGAEEAGESQNDGLFAGVDDAGDADDGDDLTQEAELPTAPKLGGDGDDASQSFAEKASKSLLIQLDKIQKEGRNKAVGKTILAVVLMVAMGGIWYYRWSTFTPNQEPEDDQTEYVQEADDDFSLRTYGEDELNKIHELEARVIRAPSESDGQPMVAKKSDLEARKNAASSADEADQNDSKPADSPDGETSADEKPTRLAKAEQSASQSDDGQFLDRGTLLGETGGNSLDEALGESKKREVEGNEKGKKLDEAKSIAQAEEVETGSSGSGLGFESIGAIESNGPSFKRPEDTLGKKSESNKIPPELTTEQIDRGIKDVSKSVAVCRQRHARRGAPLEVRKVYLTVTVQPSGKVSNYKVDPKKLNGTAFERCLATRRGRWNFGRFEGEQQQLKTPFIMQ